MEQNANPRGELLTPPLIGSAKAPHSNPSLGDLAPKMEEPANALHFEISCV